MTKAPREWCDPKNAFGQLTDEDGRPITKRHWLHSDVRRPEDLAAFRTAVAQNVICLYVRQAKNARPHPNPNNKPSLMDATYPLQAVADADPRGLSVASWQRKMTGVRAFTLRDIAVLRDILPGAMPSEADIAVFLAVAEKRIAPPARWEHDGVQWPDT